MNVESVKPARARRELLRRYSLVPDDHLRPPVGAPDKVADKVGHSAGGHEQGGLLSEQLRRLGLQPLDRRVFAEDVVANLGLIDRLIVVNIVPIEKVPRNSSGPQQEQGGRSISQSVSRVVLDKKYNTYDNEDYFLSTEVPSFFAFSTTSCLWFCVCLQDTLVCWETPFTA